MKKERVKEYHRTEYYNNQNKTFGIVVLDYTECIINAILH